MKWSLLVSWAIGIFLGLRQQCCFGKFNFLLASRLILLLETRYWSRCSERDSKRAGVAELVDAPDLGSGAYGVGVRVPSPAPYSLVDRRYLQLFPEQR